MEANAKEWLRRAKSNFEHAVQTDKNNLISNNGEIFIEDLCFNFQQCAEKAFKAVLVHNEILFPKTHSISVLIELLLQNNINVPENLLIASTLTLYAVQTRYPSLDDYITEEEYKEALEIAESVYNWAKSMIL
jgi:HEPN domain-containing protein